MKKQQQQSSQSHYALVLPGAVARGAYEAGVIEVMAEKNIKIDRIVATSSGALNGLAYAVAIRSGCEKEMAKGLAAIWIEYGSWHDSLNFSLWGLISGRGLSNRDNLIKMMRKLIMPCEGSKKKDVELHIIVTPLNGITSQIGKKPATSYEKVIKFTGPDFDTPEKLEYVFNVVAAACAFPGLYKPVSIPGLGLCIDGGTVNNAPIKYAIQESGVTSVIMPIPFPALMKPGEWKRGLGLLSHLIEVLINERLFRDLQNAQKLNLKLKQLKSLVSEGALSQKQFEKITNILSFQSVAITEVRPDHNLKSTSFSGFFHKEDRIRLVEQGRKAALESLVQTSARKAKRKQ